MNFTNTKPQVLTADQMARIAPAIFAAAPSPKTSSKYAFIPTTAIIETLARQDFHPVRVDGTRSRKEGTKGFGTHVIRFRHASQNLTDLKVGDSIFELLLKTAHDTSSSFDFSAAAFRLACSNGLVVPKGTFGGFSVKHVGYAADDVRKGLDGMMNQLPALRAAQQQLAETALDNQERLLLAERAASLRWGENAPVAPQDLLRPRRRDDMGSDLWTTFNVIQENLVQGGVRAVGATGSRYTTKVLRNAEESVRLNRELWALADAMGKLKRGEQLALAPQA